MSLTKLKKIIEKNLKLLLRSKSSAFIIIFGPIILITLLGLSFGNTQQYTLNVGVYSPSYNEFSQLLLVKLNQRGFSVTKEPAESLCIEHVKTRDSNVCMVFPADLQVKDDVSQDITFHVDFSNVNLVYNILSALSSGVGDRAREVSISLTQDLLNRLEKTELLVDERIPTLVGLTQNTDTLRHEAERIALSMNALNLTIENNSSMVDVETEIAFLRNLAYKSMRETDDLIDILNAEINTLYGNKSRIEYQLDKAERLYGDYRGELSDSDAKLPEKLGGLRTYVADVDTKLGAVGTTRAGVLAALGEIKTNLEGSVDLLNQMQTALNEMKRLTTTVQITNAEKIVNPLTTRIVPVTEQETHFNFLFPTLIVLVVMITSILLSSTIVMVEKKSKSFFRNYITPTNEVTFLVGTYLTTLIILLVQLSIFFLVSSLFFDTALVSSLFTTPFLLFFITTFFTLTGIMVGLFFKSEELTTLASISVASLMLFFSSTILPLESMPPFFKTLASLNPFVLSESLLKESILFNLDLSTLMDKVYLLLLYSLILAFFCVKLQKWLRDDMFYNLHKSRRLVELRGAHVFKRLTGAHGKTALRIRRALHQQVGLKKGGLSGLFGIFAGAFQKKPPQTGAASASFAGNDPMEKELMEELDIFNEPPAPSTPPSSSQSVVRAEKEDIPLPPAPPPEAGMEKLQAELERLRNKLKDL